MERWDVGSIPYGGQCCTTGVTKGYGLCYPICEMVQTFFFFFVVVLVLVLVLLLLALGVMVYHTLILNMISVNNIFYPLAT